MSKKIINFLESLAPALSAESKQELDAAKSASDIAEVELSDKFISDFTGAYLTRERAKADETIRKELESEHFGHFIEKIDKQLTPLVGLLSQDKQTQFRSLTQDKKSKDAIGNLHGWFKEEIDSLSSDTDAAKRYNDLQEQFNSEQAKWAKEKEDLLASKEEELKKVKNSVIIDKKKGIIKDAVMSQKLAENIPGGKTYLADSVFNQLDSKYSLVMDGDNMVIKQKENSDLDVFEGNEKVTLNAAIESLTKEFVAKSPAQIPVQTHQPPQPGQTTPTTIRERNAQLAKLKALEILEQQKKAAQA